MQDYFTVNVTPYQFVQRLFIIMQNPVDVPLLGDIIIKSTAAWSKWFGEDIQPCVK